MAVAEKGKIWGKGRGRQRCDRGKVLAPQVFMPIVVLSDLMPEKELALAPGFAAPAGVKERKTRRGCLLAQLKKVQELNFILF